MKRIPDCCTNSKKHDVILFLAVVMVVALAGCRPIVQPSAMPSESAETQARALKTGNQAPDSQFPTFKASGLDPCTDEQGRPLILLFSASSCSHCQWVGDIFDLIARQYADQGLVTAHHYDIETGDDLLTEAEETRIPKRHLSIGRRGDPDGYLPYFNFGCRYDRIGTGYEEQNDLAAEAEEMCQVIEALLP